MLVFQRSGMVRINSPRHPVASFIITQGRPAETNMFNKLKSVFEKSEKDAAPAEGTTAARAHEVKEAAKGAISDGIVRQPAPHVVDPNKPPAPKKEKVEVLTEEQQKNSMAPM